MKKVLLPIGLWLSLLIVLVLGIIVSETVLKSYDDVPFNGAMYELFGKYDQYKVKETTGLAQIDNEHKLTNSYEIKKAGKLYGYAYLAVMNTAEYNKKPMTILYGCEIETKKLLGFKIIDSDPNDYYYSDNYQAGFSSLGEKINGSLLSNPYFGSDFNVVSGASKTRDALANGAILARQQFYKDTNDTIPVAFTYQTSKQLFDDLANVTRFEYTFDNDGNVCKVVYNYDVTAKTLTYVSDDSELSSEDLSACLKIASGKLPTVFVNSVTPNATVATNYDLVISTKGYGGGQIIVKMTVSETTIVNYSVENKGGQSYDEEYNTGYAGNDPFDAADTDVIEHQNNFDEWTVCTGATITLNAIKAAVSLAYEFISVLGGAE